MLETALEETCNDLKVVVDEVMRLSEEVVDELCQQLKSTIAGLRTWRILTIQWLLHTKVN